MRKLFLCFIFLGFLLMSVHSVSQVQGVLSKKWYGNWSVGISGGPNMYWGHLSVNDYWPVSENIDGWKYAGTFYLTRQFSHVFALRGQVMYGEIAGSKRSYTDGTPYDKYFEGTLLEYNLNTTINLSNLLFRYKPERIFFIYGTVGAGVTSWNTTVKDLQTHELIGDSGSVGKWTYSLVVPAGLGAYFNIADRVNLGFEWTVRAVNTEKLNASKTPVSFQYDMYSLLSLNLVFNLNRRNPVKLDAVNATMPPVVLPKPQAPAGETPAVTPQPAVNDQELTTNPPSVKPDGFPNDSIKPLPDTAYIPESQMEPKAVQLFQLPGLEADIFYRVQIYSAKTGERSERSVQSSYNLKQPVVKEFSEGYYRYYAGEFENEMEANQFAASLRSKPGLKGAFVVKYINGTRELTNPK